MAPAWLILPLLSIPGLSRVASPSGPDRSRIGYRVRLFSGGWRGNGKEGFSADERVRLQLGVLGVGGDTDQPGRGMIDRSTRSTLRIVSKTVLESRTCAGGHGWPA